MGIVLTGGVVRVTGSGLGCPEWPTCDGTSWVPVDGVSEGMHSAIEFGNRLLTFVLVTVAVGVAVAAWRQREQRRDLFRLAAIQPIGIVLQALWGGLTVLTDLHPLIVASHFLLSAALVAAAVTLVFRAFERHVAATPTVPAGRRLAVGLLVVAGLVLVLGTLVTGAGPHAGDADAQRLALDIRVMAIAHADAVWLLLGLTVAVLVVARTTGDRTLVRAAALLLGLELAQGTLGYVQYAVGIPAHLVALHIAGAISVWAAAVHVALQAHARPDPAAPTTASPPPARTSVTA